MKKALTLLLCMALLVSIFCITVSAADGEIPTAPADAIVDEDGAKIWYEQGVQYTELPPAYVNTTIDPPCTIVEGEKVTVKNEDAMTPYGLVSSSIIIPYYCVLSDIDGQLLARFTITISGLIYGTTRAEIESATCNFTYTATSNYTSSISRQGNTATVRILLDGACLARYTFTLNVDSSITVT